jgi:hypothetical protein
VLGIVSFYLVRVLVRDLNRSARVITIGKPTPVPPVYNKVIQRPWSIGSHEALAHPGVEHKQEPPHQCATLRQGLFQFDFLNARLISLDETLEPSAVDEILTKLSAANRRAALRALRRVQRRRKRSRPPSVEHSLDRAAKHVAAHLQPWRDLRQMPTIEVPGLDEAVARRRWKALYVTASAEAEREKIIERAEERERRVLRLRPAVLILVVGVVAAQISAGAILHAKMRSLHAASRTQR